MCINVCVRNWLKSTDGINSLVICIDFGYVQYVLECREVIDRIECKWVMQ